MIFDFIAAFYYNANDEVPAYRIPVNTVNATADQMLQMGFYEDPEASDDYHDYIQTVTEERLEELSNDDCACEVLSVTDGVSFEKIVLHAYEMETIDGVTMPRGIYVGDHSVHFTGNGPDALVVFTYGDKCFGRPLGVLKERYGAKTMFQVMDIIKEFLDKHPYADGERVRQEFGAGVDDAIRLMAEKFYGMLDFDDNPAVLHSLEVGHAGKTRDEQIVGYLHDIVEETDTTLADLVMMGFTLEVVECVRLLTRVPGFEYMDYIKNILDYDIDTAINVKVNELKHNLERGRITYEHANEWGNDQMAGDIAAINMRRERALNMMLEDLDRQANPSR